MRLTNGTLVMVRCEFVSSLLYSARLVNMLIKMPLRMISKKLILGMNGVMYSLGGRRLDSIPEKANIDLSSIILYFLFTLGIFTS